MHIQRRSASPRLAIQTCWLLTCLFAASLAGDALRASADFFSQSLQSKQKLSRSLDMPWGYYDRELTKNLRDRKEIFDFSPVEPAPWPAMPETAVSPAVAATVPPAKSATIGTRACAAASATKGATISPAGPQPIVKSTTLVTGRTAAETEFT